MKLQLLFIYSILIISNSTAQSINFEFSNGTNNEYFIPYTKKILFESNQLKLYYNDGTLFSWHVDSIKFFNFNSSSISGLDDLNNICEKLDVVLFPNPTYDELKLNFDDSFNEDFDLLIYDIKGIVYFKKVVKKEDLEVKSLTISLNSLPSNQYICVLKIKKLGLMSKPFIKQ